MIRSLRLPLAAATIAAFTAGAVAQEAEEAPPVSADTVVAVVNGTEITVAHLLIARTQLSPQFQQLPDEVLFPGLLDQLVQQTVLAQSVETPPARTEIVLENERRALLAGAAIDSLIAETVTEEAIQAAYEERYADAEPVTEYDASHILLETEADAQAVVEALDEGADFAALAQERSIGPSGPGGGALGWGNAETWIPEFANAVAELEPGSYSGPVETQFGWHVILLNDTRLQEAPPLEEVRPEIEGALQQEAVQAHVEELTAGAQIDRSGAEGVDPSAVSNFELLAD